MYTLLLGQTTAGGLPSAVVVALILAGLASALALVISIGIARRISAIGDRRTTNDQRRTTDDERRLTNDRRPTTNDQRPTTGEG